MKIVITEGNRSVTVEHTTDGMTVSEVVENLFRPVMLGMGYASESIDKVIGECDYDSIINEND